MPRPLSPGKCRQFERGKEVAGVECAGQTFDWAAMRVLDAIRLPWLEMVPVLVSHSAAVVASFVQGDGRL